jgi:undecaprenyl-diphosphatase
MLDYIVIFFAEYAYLLVVGIAFLFFVLSVPVARKGIVIIGLSSGLIALVVDKVSSYFIKSPRPFVIENITPLFPHVMNNGFPSEHTLFATVIAATLFLYNKKLGIGLMILVLCIGLARVLANVHHMVDIVGGVVIGVVPVWISRYFFSRLSYKK